MLQILKDVGLLLKDIRIRHSQITSEYIFESAGENTRDVGYFVNMGEYALSRLEEEEKILKQIQDDIRECLSKTRDDHAAVKRFVRAMMRRHGYRWTSEKSLFDYEGEW